MNEIELKFLIDEAAARQLRARVRALKLASGAAKTRTLRSIYFDTAGHTLKHAGLALRLRRNGRRWVQTVKAAGELHGGLSQVGELESPAPGGRVSLQAIPNPLVRDRVVECVNGQPLQPVCATVIRRTEIALAPENGTRAELAIDVGEILAEGRSAALREAEIELIEGGPRGLFDIAQALLPDGGWRFSRLSKGARGYLLAEEGRIEPELAPRTAQAVALDAGLTTEQAARDILRECFDQIATNIAVVRALDDPEGPHQLRIGLRRLRSALSIFSSVLACPEMGRLNAETRWLGREVGRLRDVEVVLNDIVRREAGAHPGEVGIAALADRLAPQADDLRRSLRGILAGARVQTLLLDLARFTETRGWLLPHDFGQTERLARPAAAFAGGAINRSWKKVVKRAHGLATLDVAQRHELRKELKKLRYVVEFLAPLYADRRVSPFVRRLKKLQTIFGELNDAATVKAMFARQASNGDGDPSSARAVGWVTGASLARADYAWNGAKALWRRLEGTKPFWK
jgi:inorganic triphosphatase YgiF